MVQDKDLSKSAEEDADIDELQLVRECQQGLLESYEPLVKKYQARICASAYHFVRNETEAEELAQLAFVKAWRKIGSFNGKSNFYTWLYRITTNTCLDYLRQKKRQREVVVQVKMNDHELLDVEEMKGREPGPDRMAGNRELKEEIENAIKQLSADHQVVIVMREIQGLSYEEIAQTLGCSTGTVMSRLFYARKYLRDKLESKL